MARKASFSSHIVSGTSYTGAVLPKPASIGLRENRLIRLEGYPGDVVDTYFRGKGLLRKGAGIVSLGVEGIDQGVRRLTGRDYEAPRGIMGRTRRDLGDVFEHLKEGEIIQAASAGWSVVSGDILMDGIDAVGGYR